MAERLVAAAAATGCWSSSTTVRSRRLACYWRSTVAVSERAAKVREKFVERKSVNVEINIKLFIGKLFFSV